MLDELHHGLRRGDTVDVVIDRISERGRGAADYRALVGPQRQEKHWVVNVRKAQVGDHVRAVVESRRRRQVEARLEQLLTPSAARVEPRCRHFGRREQPGRGCGGCTLQATDYPAQLEVKRRRVEALMAAAGIDPGGVAEVIGAVDPWRYRNKMEFSFGDDRQRDLAVGLYPTGYRNEVLNLSECHLISEAGAAVVPLVRRWADTHGIEPYNPRRDTGFVRQLTLREGKRTDERLVELVTTGAESARFDGEEVAAAVVADSFATLMQRAPVTSVHWTQHHAVRGQRTTFHTTHLGGAEVYHEVLAVNARRLRFAVHPRAFFQPNPRMAEVLCTEVLARLGEAHTVLDLYCGTGTLGLCVAPSVQRVVGVELVAEAVANARANAAANGIHNVEYLVGDVAEVMTSPAFAALAAQVDAVMVDPPRAGLSAQALQQVASVGARQIVYVSCNPASLARDLAALAEVGYRIDGKLQPVDLFPHTHHVETVVALRAS